MTTQDWTVEDHLVGKPAEAVALYHRFAALVEQCGPVRVAVSKSCVAFKGDRRGFAGARPTRNGLRGYLDLQRRVDDPRFTSVAPYTKRLFVHQVSISSMSQLDDDFAAWIAEAYEVGEGAHLLAP